MPDDAARPTSTPFKKTEKDLQALQKRESTDPEVSIDPSHNRQGAREEDMDRSVSVPLPGTTPGDLEGDAIGSQDTPG